MMSLLKILNAFKIEQLKKFACLRKMIKHVVKIVSWILCQFFIEPSIVLFEKAQWLERKI